MMGMQTDTPGTEVCYARFSNSESMPATPKREPCYILGDVFGPVGQELVHYATKKVFGAARHSSPFMELDNEILLSIIDDFKKEYPEQYETLLQEVSALTQADFMSKKSNSNLAQRILTAILLMAYMSFTAVPSLSASEPYVGYDRCTGYGDHESIPVGNMGANEDIAQLATSTDESLKWQSYIDRLKGPPRKLTEEQLIKAEEIHKVAINKNLGNPHADILTDEDDKKFFRLFWKPENVHHLEIDIYEDGYVDWFYMNMESKDKDYADKYDDEKSLEALFSIINRVA